MAVQKITSMAQFDALFESDKIFFVDFYADWCDPCKQIAPDFERERLAGAHATEVIEFYKLNIDNIPVLADALGVRSVPTFHAYKGKERLRPVGANRAELEDLIRTGLQT